MKLNKYFVVVARRGACSISHEVRASGGCVSALRTFMRSKASEDLSAAATANVRVYESEQHWIDDVEPLLSVAFPTHDRAHGAKT